MKASGGCDFVRWSDGRLVNAGSQSFGGFGLCEVARSIPVGLIASGLVLEARTKTGFGRSAGIQSS